MSRKPRFDFDTKLYYVEAYINGKLSVKEISNEINVDHSTFYRWTNSYKVFGSNALINYSSNRSYDEEFKVRVINEFNNGETTKRQLCLKYNISSPSVLYSWINKYNNPNEKMLGESIYMPSGNKFTYEQKIEVVKWCIDNDKDYTSTAKKFKCSYNNVYSWTKKYEKLGPDGLIDYRGSKRPEENLTDMEKLVRYNKELEARLKQKEMEIAVLKKLKEIEGRL